MLSSNLEQYKKRVFLCHRKEDEAFVKSLAERLINNKIDVWVDYEDLLPGEDWRNTILKNISSTDAMLVIVSSSAYKNKSVFHEEIDFALDYNEKKSKDQQLLISPIMIDPTADIYPPLKAYHHVRVDNLYQGDWFEKLLQSIGIIKNRAVEFSLERQQLVVDIERLKLELAECWIRKKSYAPSSKQYFEEEEVASNIVKYIDDKCEKIGERFDPTSLYRKIKFDHLIKSADPIPQLEEIIFYPPNGILVHKKYIKKRVYVVEKGGEPKYAVLSKKIGQFEYENVICGFALIYSYSADRGYIELGKEYDVYDGYHNDYAILIGSFKAEKS